MRRGIPLQVDLEQEVCNPFDSRSPAYVRQQVVTLDYVLRKYAGQFPVECGMLLQQARKISTRKNTNRDITDAYGTMQHRVVEFGLIGEKSARMRNLQNLSLAGFQNPIERY